MCPGDCFAFSAALFLTILHENKIQLEILNDLFNFNTYNHLYFVHGLRVMLCCVQFSIRLMNNCSLIRIKDKNFDSFKVAP